MSPASDKKSYAGHISLAIIFLVLLATLSLHCVVLYDDIQIFPKDNFTFSNTLITQDDVSQIIRRYNESNFIGKIAIRNEPVVKKLFEKGIIMNTEKPDSGVVP